MFGFKCNFRPNNFNFFNQQNCPIKIITNKCNINGIYDSSSINSVLQIFGGIKYINFWIQFFNANGSSIIYGNKIITKSFYDLLVALIMGQFPDSSNLIMNYINKYKLTYKGNIKQDPYHFLYYLLDFIHLETNTPSNPNFNVNILSNINLTHKRNDMFMYNLFSSFLKNSQNSIISNYFFNILGYRIQCINCPTTYFYQFKYIIKFNINDYLNYRNLNYPNKINTNLTLGDCFDYYTTGNDIQCQCCGNFKAKLYCSFVSPPKILILALIRNSHTYKCDIYFSENIDIKGYMKIGHDKCNYTNYCLKACVGLNNLGKYFSDVKINNCWYRFYLNQCSLINNSNELLVYEPQLLIYELNENNFQGNGWGFC